MVVLVVVAAIDALIYLFAGRCLVCYRCRSEFRNLPISQSQLGWDLSTGEKYRQASGQPSLSESQGQNAPSDELSDADRQADAALANDRDEAVQGDADS